LDKIAQKNCIKMNQIHQIYIKTASGKRKNLNKGHFFVFYHFGPTTPSPGAAAAQPCGPKAICSGPAVLAVAQYAIAARGLVCSSSARPSAPSRQRVALPRAQALTWAWVGNSLPRLGLEPARWILAVLHHPTDVRPESPSLVLVIYDTKLLMSCVKCFELGISNTCDEGVCGKEWWPQDHKEMVHGHEMMIMVEMHLK
jgi:hypothetical protein